MVKLTEVTFGPDDPIYQNPNWTIYVPKGLKSSNSTTPGLASPDLNNEQSLPTTDELQEIEEDLVDKKWKRYVTPAEIKNDFELFKAYYPGLTWEEFEEFIENYIDD